MLPGSRDSYSTKIWCEPSFYLNQYIYFFTFLCQQIIPVLLKNRRKKITQVKQVVWNASLTFMVGLLPHSVLGFFSVKFPWQEAFCGIKELFLFNHHKGETDSVLTEEEQAQPSSVESITVVHVACVLCTWRSRRGKEERRRPSVWKVCRVILATLIFLICEWTEAYWCHRGCPEIWSWLKISEEKLFFLGDKKPHGWPRTCHQRNARLCEDK